MFGISYWILPLFAACVWLGTLLAMLGTWIAEGSPHYASMGASQRIAYISDVGAEGLKPLFIAGSAVCVVVFDVCFISERWLRHTGRLAHNTGKLEKAFSIISVLAAIIGAAGLILLSIFDTLRYPHVHDAMLAVFIIGYVVSAIFICAEYQRLGVKYRQHSILRMSFWIKLAFIFIEVGLAIGFGVTNQRGNYNTAAILEWIIALIYICYVASFIMDFIPAVHSKHHRFPTVEEIEQGRAEGLPSVTGGPTYSHETSSYGSAQPMAEANGGPGRYYGGGSNVQGTRAPAEANVTPSRNF